MYFFHIPDTDTDTDLSVYYNPRYFNWFIILITIGVSLVTSYFALEKVVQNVSVPRRVSAHLSIGLLLSLWFLVPVLETKIPVTNNGWQIYYMEANLVVSLILYGVVVFSRENRAKKLAYRTTIALFTVALILFIDIHWWVHHNHLYPSDTESPKFNRIGNEMMATSFFYLLILGIICLFFYSHENRHGKVLAGGIGVILLGLLFFIGYVQYRFQTVKDLSVYFFEKLCTPTKIIMPILFLLAFSISLYTTIRRVVAPRRKYRAPTTKQIPLWAPVLSFAQIFFLFYVYFFRFDVTMTPTWGMGTVLGFLIVFLMIVKDTVFLYRFGEEPDCTTTLTILVLAIGVNYANLVCNVSALGRYHSRSVF